MASSTVSGFSSVQDFAEAEDTRSSSPVAPSIPTPKIVTQDSPEKVLKGITHLAEKLSGMEAKVNQDFDEVTQRLRERIEKVTECTVMMERIVSAVERIYNLGTEMEQQTDRYNAARNKLIGFMNERGEDIVDEVAAYLPELSAAGSVIETHQNDA